MFEVRSDRDGGSVLIGELTVSTGGVRWRPSHGRSAHFLEWERFGALMETLPKE